MVCGSLGQLSLLAQNVFAERSAEAQVCYEELEEIACKSFKPSSLILGVGRNGYV